MSVAELTAAILALPDEQRVALCSQAIRGITNPACAHQMRCLATAARIEADALTKELFLRDCG